MKKTEYISPMLGEKYQQITHENGLRIFVFPKQMTTFYALFSTEFGSVDDSYLDRDGKPVCFPDGLAHFLEHKMFDNPDGSDSFARFSSLGVDANAYTSYDRTAYLFSGTEHFEEALEELLKFVTHPYYTDATVKKEQGIIGEEIRMYGDRPWSRGYQNLLAGLYFNNPVRKEICGSVKSIAKITAETLYEAHRHFYDLSNMVLSVAGNVTAEQVLAVVDRVLPGTPSGYVLKKPEPVSEPRTVKTAMIRKKMPISQPIFHFGFKDSDIPADPLERTRKDAGMTVLNEILFSKSGTFYNRLLEEELLTGSFSGDYSITKTFAYNCISGESDHPDLVLERLFDYLDEVIRNGIDEEEFERSRRVLYADEICEYDSTDEIAERMLTFAFDRVDMFLYPELIKTIRKEELERLLKTVFRKEYLTVSIVEPEERK